MRKAIQGLSVVVLGLMLSACHSGGGGPDGGSVGGPGDGSAAASVCQAPAPDAQDPATRPNTIPALQLWSPAAGVFHFAPASRIVLAKDDSVALMTVAEVLADDLRTQSGTRPAIVSGSAVEGDILLSRGHCDSRLGREGYGFRTGSIVEIQANEAAGVFYGTRTLLQLLAQGSGIPAGHALDWPRYPERGFMVDVGRKYFTPEWLNRHIREIAFLKMNVFHFHFSENQGFRVESESHPEIVSEQHLTKDEVREMVALASRYFITVIPEIGMPSHMGAALAPHPELQLKDVFGQASPNNLDVSNPAAAQFARDLIEEYLPLFPGPYWHTGADEYIPFYDYLRYPQLQAYAQEKYGPGANGKDAVHGHINWVADLVAQHGKTTRVWNDDLNGGSAVTVNPNIVVEWWTDFQPLGDIVLIPSPQELLDRGHRILNAGNWPTYLTLGGMGGIQTPPDMAAAYETWDVYQFAGAFFNGPVHTPYKAVAADESRNLGAKHHVWLDGGDAIATEDEVAAGVAPRLRVIAQKGWNSPLLTPAYTEFQAVTDAIGHSPGYADQ